MSKINAVRIINLNYNNNSMRISDETFQMGGKNTLMSLRNGGGKTVFVQMMTAPFVHKQYRRTKDRPFESYFTSSKPTFIMVEWALDHGAGYCLTGMMVRRSQLVEEQSSEPLEIINFISEYTKRSEYDIYNIPVVEKSKNEVVLKNFNVCKQLFESYKKDSDKKFYFYDMNNYSQQRQYFNKLEEYKIYYKEWEDIIRRVNIKESGLSELFSDCKNEKELLEKWFIETIGKKLNREQDRMKEFQTIIEKYVRMYKDNKSKIERRDTIMCFKEDMDKVLENAHEYQKTEDKVSLCESYIARIIKELSYIEEELKSKLQELNLSEQECRDSVAHYYYEKLSSEFHKLNDELRIVVGKKELIDVEREQLYEAQAEVEKKIHILECAKQQQEVDERREEYELITQKIDVLKKDEKELEPERQKIGGYLKQQYINKLDYLNEAILHNNTEIQKYEELCQQYSQKVEDYMKKIDKLRSDIVILSERINNFSQREDEYNKRYKESFSRNIMGEYEAGLLEICQNEYDKEFTKLTREIAAHINEQQEKEEKKKICERDKEDKRKEKEKNELECKLMENELEQLKKQLEERRNIMLYLDADFTLIWNREKLLEVADRKMSDIDRSKQALINEEKELQKEWKKLTSGEVLELPQDFMELLQELDIKPVYGMQWLDKNGKSKEENVKLIRRHPFLPYALILSQGAIEKIEKNNKDIYTSYPIPIIPREALDDELLNEDSSILKLQSICFYVWFNEKLLDEEALKVMIAQLEQDIKKKNEQIAQRGREYNEYSEKRSKLSQQTVTKEMMEEKEKQIIETEERIETLTKEIIDIDANLRQLNDGLQLLVDLIRDKKLCKNKCEERTEDFKLFCTYYKEYLENRIEKELREKDLNTNECNKKQVEELLVKYKNNTDTFKATERSLKEQTGRANEKLLKYNGYNVDEGLSVELAFEAAEARYEAITTKMSVELQEIEKNQQKAATKLTKVEEDLTKIMIKYQLAAELFRNVIYNDSEYTRQEIILEETKKKLKKLDNSWNQEDKNGAVLIKEMDMKKNDIQEKCNCDEPMSKNEISTINFEEEINKLNHRITEIKNECKKIEAHKDSINHNLSSLSEYAFFQEVSDVQLEEKIVEFDDKKLREYVGTAKRDYTNCKDNLKKKKDKVEADINFLLRKDIYQEDYYRKPLEAILSVTERAGHVLAQINTTLQSYESQMAKLAVDIAMVEKEKEKIKGLLEDYVKEVHSNMAQIDNNSTITIRERPIKMLRLNIPDWDANEGLYNQRLDDFMNELTWNGIEIYEKNENAINYFSSRVTTKNLYDIVVGIGNIQIKLYKIEEQREYPITWAEVAKNSGGEGFLSAFVILSSLLQYMRRDDTDIFADRNEGKVLVMDNPFAQTNAVHLLKPLMDMAKKTNTQLICLSGLGGDSIYGRFDNIYVLNLVNASLRDGMQYLRGKHTKGNEEETVVSSRIEVLKQHTLLF